MVDVGYSGTPLIKKLGLKEDQDILFVGLPSELVILETACAFRSGNSDWPQTRHRRLDCICWFGNDRGTLEHDASLLFSLIRPDGNVWICWPKKASKIPTTVTEDVLRAVLLPTGLVDVKVCAVSDVWSGLKFVVRKELRSRLD